MRISKLDSKAFLNSSCILLSSVVINDSSLVESYFSTSPNILVSIFIVRRSESKVYTFSLSFEVTLKRTTIVLFILICSFPVVTICETIVCWSPILGLNFKSISSLFCEQLIRNVIAKKVNKSLNVFIGKELGIKYKLNR